MRQLQFNNKALMMLVTDTAVLKAVSTAGSSVSLTLDDNKNFTNADYLLFGEIGKPKSEIAKINTAVTLGTTVVVDTLTYAHPIGTPVSRIPYNQVKFYRSATLVGTKTLLTDGTVTIDAQNEYTTFVDSINSTGYLFFTLYNATTTSESGYSAGFNYGTIPYGSRIKIREIVTSKHFWDKTIDDTTFNTLCDFAESEIFSIRRWRFREKTVPFTTVTGKQAYTKTEAGLTDLGQLIYATYTDTTGFEQPVIPVTIKEHQYLNRNMVVSGQPRYIWEWDNSIYLTPIPSEATTMKVSYFRDSIGFADETVESEVKLPQAIAFRILQDLWAMVDANKSQYFERRYLQTISAMKIDDIKQVSKFPTLTDNRMDRLLMNTQVDNPTITI